MEYKNLFDRFIRYVKINTVSNEESETYPSTDIQFDLARLLFSELKELGLSDVNIDENAYVMATLPSNTTNNTPVIGFIAHMDTSPEMPGENVNPMIHKDYDGKDIMLDKDNNVFLSVEEFPELKNYIGQTLITTDGKTLLGADDKAGIAEIMTALEYLQAHPEIKHGTIKVCFTPDEEIGRGVDKFDVKKFNADFAYTVDGGKVGELEYENFNAAVAKITIKGRNIHPGYAKNKMINSMLIAYEFNALLPSFDKPEFTQDYEGFFHLVKMDGDVENSFLQYIIRDHNKKKFEERKVCIQNCGDFINKKYNKNLVTVEIKEQYLNMKEKIEPVFHIVENAKKAIEMAGVEPEIIPIRGGTDGARLSFMGLPCPNIFAGGHNFHGKYEYIPYQSMTKAVDVILNIIKIYS